MQEPVSPPSELYGSRPTSAPPILEQFDMMVKAKAAAQFVSGLSDIRTAAGYNEFYSSNLHLYPHLPPPLDYSQQRSDVYQHAYSQFSSYGAGLPTMNSVSPYAIGNAQPVHQSVRHPYPVPGMYGDSDQPVTQRTQPVPRSGRKSDPESPRSIPVLIPKASSGPKGSPIWKPLLMDPTEEEPEVNPRGHYSNKNFGKVTLHKDSELSSSTDDLLKLAGAGHLLKLAEERENEEAAKRNFRVLKSDSGTNSPAPSTKNSHYGYSKQRDLTADMQNLSIHPQHLPQQPNLDSFAQYQTQVTAPASTVNASKYNNICRYYMNGYCSRGERCNYSHGDADSEARRMKFARVPASRYTNLTVEECKGEIYSMCLDQHGCRFLQKELDKNDAQVTQLIFAEVITHIVELTRDPFGNYLCQKLVEHCSEEQRLGIVKSITNEIVRISKNMHGTRAVQKIIECLDTNEEIKVIRDALKGSVVELIQDLNGNHVIQKCLHRLEPNDNQFIYDVVAIHCIQVATHRHGCCVFQRCIDHGTAYQKKQLVDQIKVNSVALVQDAFGNYVVQYALDLDFPDLATDLIVQFHGKMYQLAKQKFSSNVVEKCLKMGSHGCVKRAMRELLCEDVDPTILTPVPQQPREVISKLLLDLLQDSYGNYVVQTCLFEGSTKAVREYRRMADLLVPYLHQLRNTPYSKRIQHLLSLPTKNPDDEEGEIVEDEKNLVEDPYSQIPLAGSNGKAPTALARNRYIPHGLEGEMGNGNGNGNGNGYHTMDMSKSMDLSPRFLPRSLNDTPMNKGPDFRYF